MGKLLLGKAVTKTVCVRNYLLLARLQWRNVSKDDTCIFITAGQLTCLQIRSQVLTSMTLLTIFIVIVEGE